MFIPPKVFWPNLVGTTDVMMSKTPAVPPGQPVPEQSAPLGPVTISPQLDVMRLYRFRKHMAECL